MSWERMWDRQEESPCACGNGVVIRRERSESDDWNRSRSSYYGQKIQCDHCSKKYRIERRTIHFFCPPWKGDGIARKEYLVPRNMKFPHNVEEKKLNLTQLDERIVASFKREELEEIINDMIASRYSTQVKLDGSQRIVKMYQHRYKKRGLLQIIDFLKISVRDYDTYQWTYLKAKEYEENERVRAANSQGLLDDVLSKSYELKFQYVEDN